MPSCRVLTVPELTGIAQREFRREAVDLAVDGAEEGRVVAEQAAVLPAHVRAQLPTSGRRS